MYPMSFSHCVGNSEPCSVLLNYFLCIYLSPKRPGSTNYDIINVLFTSVKSFPDHNGILPSKVDHCSPCISDSSVNNDSSVTSQSLNLTFLPEQKAQVAGPTMESESGQ